jgi:hypothetical protein
VSKRDFLSFVEWKNAARICTGIGDLGTPDSECPFKNPNPDYDFLPLSNLLGHN